MALQSRIVDYSRGWLTTKISEDGFRILRKKAEANDNKALARRLRWAALAESDLFSDAHRPTVEVSCEDRDAGSKLVIDNELFSSSVGASAPSLPQT